MPTVEGVERGERRRLLVWQGVTVALLFLGYAGYYLCRSDFSVTLPQLIDELSLHGMTTEEARIRLGQVSSWGVFAYAIGKLLLGGTADWLGGRRNFLAGMGGAVVFTVMFGMGGGLPIFTLAWVGNRLVQSVGWAGAVKVSSRWFSYAAYGTMMGVISLSYLFGDAASRWFMGALLGRGLGWRAIFFTAAGTLAVLFVANLLLLKDSRAKVGLPEPEVNPDNVYAGKAPAQRRGIREVLGPLMTSVPFWLVCLLSLGTTLVRETFNTWTPTYFNQGVGYSKAMAADLSALFPLFGGFAVVLAGWWSDKIGRKGRAAILFWGLALAAAALLGLGMVHWGSARLIPVGLVALIGFLIIGPYSYLAGAIAMDFGGSEGSATASGLIDGVGYLGGGVLAGDTMARISVSFGWSGAFVSLSGVAALSAVCAYFYLRKHE